jgi:hypothetical protein
MDIEKLIWKMIMDIAQGNKDVHAVLTDFVTAAPWNEIQWLSHEDPFRHWFMLGEIISVSISELHPQRVLKKIPTSLSSLQQCNYRVPA